MTPEQIDLSYALLDFVAGEIGGVACSVDPTKTAERLSRITTLVGQNGGWDVYGKEGHKKFTAGLVNHTEYIGDSSIPSCFISPDILTCQGRFLAVLERIVGIKDEAGMRSRERSDQLRRWARHEYQHRNNELMQSSPAE